jgi:S-adenosylmethionine:tRNA ribosyltransferase-isomerase
VSFPALHTADFQFDLPAELIAQHPAAKRDESRLLVLSRQPPKLSHTCFASLADYLRPGDLLVLNDSKVIPARLRGRNRQTGGEFEMLLLEENARNDWWVMLRPGKRARPHTQIGLINRAGETTTVLATVIDKNPEGHRRLRFSGTSNLADELESLGEVPLPPYIKRDPGADLREDLVRYQTVYARADGSVAAPTAGLHFTQEMFERIRARGVEVCRVTLHVGLGTFAPVKTATLAAHTMHEERYAVGEETARLVNAAKSEGRRVVAVGTTSVRVLEHVAAGAHGRVVVGAGRTRLFIHPPWRFRVVDALLTNFHLPGSTLLMLVSAFAAPGETSGRARVLAAYAEAVRQRYRFFSYGDAMLIL